LILTDFYRHQAGIPRGWSLLSLPADFFQFPIGRPILVAVPCLFVLLVLVARVCSGVPALLKAPLVDSLLPLSFLAGWTICGYTMFLLVMPAASFFNFTISYWGPGHLIIPVIAAALIRAGRASFASRAPSGAVEYGTESFPKWAIAAGLLLAALYYLNPNRMNGTSWQDLDQIASRLRAMNLRKDTRLYASPNDHLTLSLYLGLPVQSIAPIRKSFLDRYPGDVVLIQRDVFDHDPGAIGPKELEMEAVQNSRSLSAGDAQHLSAALRTRNFRKTALQNVTGSPVAMESIPPFAARAYQQYEQESHAANDPRDSFLITRGFSISNHPEFGEVFCYRFVDPNSRRGPKLNYAARLRGAHADVLMQSGTVIYRSPARRPLDADGIDFTFVY
jgi:hypothetical protein